MRIHLCLGLVLVFGMSFAGLAAAEQIKRRPHDPKPNVKQPAETKKPKPANFLAGDEKWMPKPSSSASAADETKTSQKTDNAQKKADAKSFFKDLLASLFQPKDNASSGGGQAQDTPAQSPSSGPPREEIPATNNNKPTESKPLEPQDEP